MGTISAGAEACSKNLNCNIAFENDPCCYQGGHRPHSVVEIYKEMQNCHKNMHLFNENFIIVSAGIDTSVSVGGAFDMMEKSPSKDKTLLLYMDALHDIAHEEEI